MNLEIGSKFNYVAFPKDTMLSNNAKKTRLIEVVGIFYEGCISNSDCMTVKDLLSHQKKMIQYTIEGLYTHSEPSKITTTYDSFIKEILDEQKLMPEFRRYNPINVII